MTAALHRCADRWHQCMGTLEYRRTLETDGHPYYRWPLARRWNTFWSPHAIFHSTKCPGSTLDNWNRSYPVHWRWAIYFALWHSRGPPEMNHKMWYPRVDETAHSIGWVQRILSQDERYCSWYCRCHLSICCESIRLFRSKIPTHSNGFWHLQRWPWAGNLLNVPQRSMNRLLLLFDRYWMRSPMPMPLPWNCPLQPQQVVLLADDLPIRNFAADTRFGRQRFVVCDIGNYLRWAEWAAHVLEELAGELRLHHQLVNWHPLMLMRLKNTRFESNIQKCFHFICSWVAYLQHHLPVNRSNSNVPSANSPLVPNWNCLASMLVWPYLNQHLQSKNKNKIIKLRQ